MIVPIHTHNFLEILVHFKIKVTNRKAKGDIISIKL